MKRSLFLLSLLFLLPLTGCRRELKALRVGYSPDLTHAAALVGVASRRFTRAGGVPVRTSVYNASPAAVEALMFRDLDIAYVSPVPAVSAFMRSKGKCVIVAGAGQGGAALVTSKDSGILDVEKLRSETIATPQLGSTADVAARRYFGELGFVSYEHGGGFRITPVSNTDLVTAFARGDVAGAWTVEPWATQLVMEAKAKILLDEARLWGVNGSTAPYPAAVVLVRRDVLRRHPRAVEDFLRMHADTTDWINVNPEAAQAIVEEALVRISRRRFAPGVMKKAWERITLSTDLLAAGIERYADDAARVGFIGSAPIDFTKLIDAGPLKRATKARQGS